MIQKEIYSDYTKCELINKIEELESEKAKSEKLRKENEELLKKLERSLKEKEILFKEIHHRVKNNLQMISSLLNLQKDYIYDKKMISIFESSQRRITAMALLHEKLYNSENLSSINIQDYINSISESLLSRYGNLSKDVKISLNIDQTLLDIDTSLYLGLIINELVSNSLKFAFLYKKEGEIVISLNKDSNKNLILKVSDNGTGLPQNFDLEKHGFLGLRLVSIIVEQLNGKLMISRENKADFTIIVYQPKFLDK